MNACQKVWWEQTQSDHLVLLLLRHSDASACHQLHYLQMVTEKLGKAYFWRTGKPPRISHAAFVRFLRALNDRSESDRSRIAHVLGFNHASNLQKWLPTVTPLAYDFERLAPQLAGDGPNPEYPWPAASPAYAPATYEFNIWNELTTTGRGRQLLRVIDAAVTGFPQYA